MRGSTDKYLIAFINTMEAFYAFSIVTFVTESNTGCLCGYSSRIWPPTRVL